MSIPLERHWHSSYDNNGFFNRTNTRTLTRSSSPVNHHAVCDDGVHGIDHIASGDIGGAAGTIFFQFVVGQIIWAERYGFKPWVHFNNVSYLVYDDQVHGKDSVEFDMMTGVQIEYIRRVGGVAKDAYPGRPIMTTSSSLQPFHYKFHGNGVWNSYFEPISDFDPTHRRQDSNSCRFKPLVTMDLYLITPGIHGFAPWSPKCWRYDYMPDYMTLPHLPYQEWLQPQRQRAHTIMTRYIRFLPYLQDMAHQVLPITTVIKDGKEDDPSITVSTTVLSASSKIKYCCGVHIRHSDKVGGRRKVPMEEFVPYVQAYVDAGGTCIYLATDSSHVLHTAQTSWPWSIRSKLHSLGPHVIRSSNDTAVFDLGVNRHRTNVEILVEILALSKCHFMIHGFSAVSETAIWIHYPTLHEQSVNLEDAEHRNVTEFEQLVRAVLAGEPAPPPRRTYEEWWKESSNTLSTTVDSSSRTNTQACQNQEQQQPQYQGILRIAHAGNKAAAGTAFFTTILNQLWYADQHQLLPWIHLEGRTSKRIYDAATHNSNNITFDVTLRRGDIAMIQRTDLGTNVSCPGKPVRTNLIQQQSLQLQGDGVWNHYFQPVSDFKLQDASSSSSCYSHLPLYQLTASAVMPGLYAHCPDAIRAWRYDQVPASLWYDPLFHPTSLPEWLYPMRRQAHALIQKYYKFQPHILAKAQQVNPLSNNNASCLAVHIRQSDKEGLYRRKFPPHKFRDYMKAYVKAGGTAIYVATDSRRALEYMSIHFPPDVLQVMRTQGKYVVRSTKKWPIFELADHHRTNSEALVDILAMSFCNVLLHGYSAMSEAAIYLNLQLHNRSVNLEDPKHMLPAEFEVLSRSVLGTLSQEATAFGVNAPGGSSQKSRMHHTGALGKFDKLPKVSAIESADEATGTSLVTQHAANTTLLFRPTRQCHENAIVYLAQKRHSSYDRDSYGLLLQSLDLLTKNYLANHSDNAELFIFHTGDFDSQDLTNLGARYSETQVFDMLRLVDLSDSQYWRRPPWHAHDNPNDWYAFHLFKEGYRHMMHWFAISIWDFFDNYNRETGCNYGMIMRLDEDSFIHSPIRYNVFDFMRNHGYVYGYRLCAYEMQVTQRMWKVYRSNRRLGDPVRDVDLEMCGFYNNFFVASLDFFRSKKVQSFLKLADRKGYIYRRRLGDLMIHSMVVYAFAPTEKIHRFLDFTYEHTTVNKTTGCVVWGGIQSGYEDDQGNLTLDTFYHNRIASRGCFANVTTMTSKDLSPSYNHLPKSVRDTLSLTSIMAGNVELPHKGLLSG